MNNSDFIGWYIFTHNRSWYLCEYTDNAIIEKYSKKIIQFNTIFFIVHERYCSPANIFLFTIYLNGERLMLPISDKNDFFLFVKKIC